MAYKTLCLIFLISFGCFKYSFTGSLPSHIKKVAIPLFENNTSFTGVNQDLTLQTTNQFILDNSLQITPESSADIIISGTVGSIIQRPAILSKDSESREEVEEDHMAVNVRVKCEDVKNNQVLWQKNLSQFGVMDASGSTEQQNDAIDVALDKISQDILNNTLGYW